MKRIEIKCAVVDVSQEVDSEAIEQVIDDFMAWQTEREARIRYHLDNFLSLIKTMTCGREK